MPFSAGTYSVAVDFGTEAASPPIEIALLDQQFADVATALSNCMLRDGTGNPTAAISFGSQDVSAMNSLTLANALADTATLTLSKGGSKIVLARSVDDGLSFVIGSDSVGGNALSLKNSGGTTTEMQLGPTVIVFKTNATTRATIGVSGNITIGAAASGDTLTIASGSAIPAGGNSTVGYCLTNTAHLGFFVGSGAPSISAAKGSLYLRTDGSSSSTRLYSASDAVGTWVAVTTAS